MLSKSKSGKVVSRMREQVARVKKKLSLGGHSGSYPGLFASASRYGSALNGTGWRAVAGAY
ncbi:MAG: hypothetical protein LBQ02_03305 [Candidatus Nomurabacteria bacterium]|nr:hypothetical protein [Candidatus Nomurabacteria bacterium]